MRAPGVLSSAFSLNASARQGACKRSLFKSIHVGVSPENQRWLPKQYWVFVRDYTRNIFRFDFWNDDVCFFVWIYEMEQFKLKVGMCFALISNQFGDLICLLLGAAIFYWASARYRSTMQWSHGQALVGALALLNSPLVKLHDMHSFHIFTLSAAVSLYSKNSKVAYLRNAENSTKAPCGYDHIPDSFRSFVSTHRIQYYTTSV